MDDLGELWAELRRRRVVRTAIVYAAVAWVVVEVTSVVQPALHLPDSLLTIVVVAALAGFPVVLILEWLYERTSGGFRRTGGEDGPLGRSALLVPLVVGGLVVAGAALAAWQFLPGAGPTGEPVAPVAQEAVAILPFAYSGPPDFEYLREGLVDLLSTKLEGVETVRPLDPRTVLAYIAREGLDPADPDVARRIAAHFGAGSFVRGSYVEHQGRLQVRAAMYRTGETGDPVVEASSDGDADDLFGIVDELAARILAGSALPSPSRLTPVAAVTTDSLGALKAFLKGEATYREGRFDEAMRAFSEATSIDPAFALAYFRLANAASWAERGDIRGPALDSAFALRERVSLQERRLIEAEAAYLRGRHRDSERLYAEIVRQNPEDAEAWYQLGELRIHRGWLYAADPTSGREAFERAVELDPRNFGALLHLTHYAAVEERFADLDSLTERILAQNGDALQSPQLRDLASGDIRARDAAVEAMATGRSGVDPLFSAFSTWFVMDPETAVLVGEATTRPGFGDGWALRGHLVLANAYWSSGRWREAREVLERATALDPAHALEHRAYLTLTAPDALAAGDLDSLQAALAAWDGTAVETEGARPTFRQPHAGLHAAARLFLLGLVEARLARPDSARARALALDTLGAPDRYGDMVRDFAVVVRAEAARGEGDPARALTILEDAGLWSVYRYDGRLSPVIAHLYPVFLRAELLRESGRGREALPWYRGLLLPVHEAPNTLGKWRSAQILASAGDTAAAERLMEVVRTRWANADPELRADLAGARFRDP